MNERDETDRWLDVLAGRTQPTDPDTREADLLRRALIAEKAKALAEDNASNTRMMNMLRAKGAFDDPVTETPVSASWLSKVAGWLFPSDVGQSMSGRYAAVAAVAMVAVLIPALISQQSQQEPGDAPTEAKSQSSVQSSVGSPTSGEVVIYASTPETASQEVAALLQRHGVTPLVSVEQANRTVTAEVPAALADKVNADLMALGLALPSSGKLVVRFVITP